MGVYRCAVSGDTAPGMVRSDSVCADEHISLHLLETGPKEVELRNFG